MTSNNTNPKTDKRQLVERKVADMDDNEVLALLGQLNPFGGYQPTDKGLRESLINYLAPFRD